MSGVRRDYLTSYEEQPNGCWNYTGTINRKGYGSILKTTAHRYFYAALVGPIPAGLTIDHLCLNKKCVNPDHLEPVTLAENVRRGSDLGRCGRCRQPIPEYGPIRRRGDPTWYCSRCMTPHQWTAADEAVARWLERLAAHLQAS